MSGYNSEKQLIFIVIFVKICYFGSHFVFRWYLKMLNADRVSAVDFWKLMVSGSQINKKTNYSETKQGWSKNLSLAAGLFLNAIHLNLDFMF